MKEHCPLYFESYLFLHLQSIRLAIITSLQIRNFPISNESLLSTLNIVQHFKMYSILTTLALVKVTPCLNILPTYLPLNTTCQCLEFIIPPNLTFWPLLTPCYLVLLICFIFFLLLLSHPSSCSIFYRQLLNIKGHLSWSYWFSPHICTLSVDNLIQALTGTISVQITPKYMSSTWTCLLNYKFYIQLYLTETYTRHTKHK